jgi:hypothetical protein
MDQKELRLEITKNWVIALDYLIDSGRIKNYRQFEELTGIRNQRVSGLKKSVTDGAESTNYISVDYIRILNEQFGVSTDYLLYGTKPIVIDPEAQLVKDVERSVYGSQSVNEKIHSMHQQIEYLVGKVNNLEKSVELTEREMRLMRAK